MRRIIIDGETILEYYPIAIGLDRRTGDEWYYYKKNATKFYIKHFLPLRETLKNLGTVHFKMEKIGQNPVVVINNTVFFLMGSLKRNNTQEISSLGDTLYAYSYSYNLKQWYNAITMNEGWLCNPGHIGKKGSHFIHNNANDYFDVTRYYTVIETLLKPEIVEISFVGESILELSPEIIYSRNYVVNKDKRVIIRKKQLGKETILEFVSDKLANKKYEDKIVKQIRDAVPLMDVFPEIEKNDIDYENYPYISIKGKEFLDDNCSFRDLSDCIVYQERTHNLWFWHIANESKERLLNVFSKEYRGVGSEGVLRTVYSEKGFAVLNANNDIIVPFGKYGFIDGFEKGYARVQNKKEYSLITNEYIGDGKWGLINENGKEVVPAIYDDIWNFYGKETWTSVCVLNEEKRVFNLYYGAFSESKYWNFKPIEVIYNWYIPEKKPEYDSSSDYSILDAFDGCSDAVGNIDAEDWL